jgi:putative hydrolase of HD superfamily
MTAWGGSHFSALALLARAIEDADDGGMSTPDDRLSQQFAFLLEIDRLKQVFRQTLIADSTRRENDAEHSWHLAMLAVVLAEYGAAGMDLGRVIRMLLVHDLVEIDAGDTYCYDPAACATQPERERGAAQRIFGLLPADQAGELRALWEEFEARETPDARFAAAVDRVQPVLLNFHTQGRAWREHAVTRSQVIERNQHVERGAPRLWEHVRGLIDEATRRGWLVEA